MYRILVVDEDSSTLCELERAGFDARAASADDALQLVRCWAPELVVLGIGARNASGLQLLRHVAAAEPRVLTVLTSENPACTDDFTSWLADAFVVKTAGGSALGLTVRRLLTEGFCQARMRPPCA